MRWIIHFHERHRVNLYTDLVPWIYESCAFLQGERGSPGGRGLRGLQGLPGERGATGPSGAAGLMVSPVTSGQ